MKIIKIIIKEGMKDGKKGIRLETVTNLKIKMLKV